MFTQLGSRSGLRFVCQFGELVLASAEYMTYGQEMAIAEKTAWLWQLTQGGIRRSVIARGK
jgi:hypothetical protein